VTALVVLEAVVIGLLVVLVAGLLRSHADILRRLHELGAGDPDEHGHRTHSSGVASGLPRPVARRTRGGGLGEVPVAAVSGATPSGGSASIPLTGSRGLTLLAFLSSGCTSCRAFWREAPDSGHLTRPDLRVVVVTRGVEEESPAAVGDLSLPGTTPLMSSEAWDAFKIPMSPYFVLVDGAAGTVLGEGAGATWTQVADLVGRALADTGADGGPRGGSTSDRLRDSDEELRRAGIAPGDPSLYRTPGDGPPLTETSPS
jgi:hypothetical protein